MKTFKFNRADIIGIVNSSVCLIHCIATPALITLGANFVVEPIVKSLFIIVAWIAIVCATENSSRAISLFLWLSFFGFIIAIFLPENYAWANYAEYTFSALIVIGHVLNIFLHTNHKHI